jgi:hypothetical protein
MKIQDDQFAISVTSRKRCWLTVLIVVNLMLAFFVSQTSGQEDTPTAQSLEPAFHYIDSSYENASPLYWEQSEDTPNEIHVYLTYDHERDATNRAAGHWRFILEAEPNVEISLVLHNFDNIWNGRHGSPVSEKTVCHARDLTESIASIEGSADEWRPIETEYDDEMETLRIPVATTTGRLEIVRLPPYTQFDLDQLLTIVEESPCGEYEVIGETVQGRPLEMIRVGSEDAPHPIVIRCRAHPWEPGGNWVVEGLLRRLVEEDEFANDCRERYAVYVMPIANKDGVAAGWTRFNMRGKDLNRQWDQPADPALCPENAALEDWLERMIGQGRRPDLLIDFHNDEGGRLHWSHPPEGSSTYLEDMARLEELLRRHTWFREGHTAPSFHNPGSIGEGLLERYGVPAIVHELNANYLVGADSSPSIELWEEYGEGLAQVFYEYFEDEHEERQVIE